MQAIKATEDNLKVKTQRYYPLVLLGLIIAIFISIIYSLLNGQADISVDDIIQILLSKLSGGRVGSLDGVSSNSAVNIIWFVRTPRVILAVFVGMGLAVTGAVMQAVVQNPLADPYILGISSGASLGATFAILIGFGTASVFSQFGLAFGAFVGAMAAAFGVLILSSIGGRMTSVKLVLSGSVIGALCSSISSFIVYLANNAEGMKTVTFWAMGSLASASWNKLSVLSVTVVLITLFFLFQYRILNVMLLGDEAAITLGVPLSRYRKLYLMLAALLTGVIVAYSGMIGFVGLIIPHIVRGLTGSDHKRLLPVSALTGSLFMIWADVLSRTLIATVELPIGIITSVIGAPLFIYIIVKKGYNFGG
ncbi:MULTISPECIES: FecCD family ABC transporter permease [unclassified Enterococcus]|uniref:FecCD family ABC transporter permease n=1 Tax=unclassified Enterococcus TaxID=2608891 RepID=UPI001CE04B06|nr:MULTISPECIES: iron ABC transporter permease [unclassified Enterococcus]MCA5013903.1 iron ABC transporter permease [Enterococcus sp. S23]MCA5017323.1 iron ABC transporter permease [Enterococcus sp. S22(2020)]